LRFSARIDKRNHKSSPRRGEDLEKGYHCEGLGDAGAMNKEHRIAWVARW